jgi:hypothetical protein
MRTSRGTVETQTTSQWSALAHVLVKAATPDSVAAIEVMRDEVSGNGMATTTRPTTANGGTSVMAMATPASVSEMS